MGREVEKALAVSGRLSDMARSGIVKDLDRPPRLDVELSINNVSCPDCPCNEVRLSGLAPEPEAETESRADPRASLSRLASRLILLLLLLLRDEGKPPEYCCGEDDSIPRSLGSRLLLSLARGIAVVLGRGARSAATGGATGGGGGTLRSIGRSWEATLFGSERSIACFCCRLIWRRANAWADSGCGWTMLPRAGVCPRMRCRCCARCSC